jgi:GT2 family glycosyltransferase
MSLTSRQHSGAAQAAIRNGQACLHAGTKAEAVQWFDRAHRIAPKDASVRLLLATALAGIDEARCWHVLRALLNQYPVFREAQIAASAAMLRRGEAAAALASFGTMLAQTAPPDSAGFRQLGAQLAQLGAQPGWLGADSQGHVQLYLVTEANAPRLALLLDDRPLRITLQPQKDGTHRLTLPRSANPPTLLTAMVGDRPLLGSPVDLAALRRVEGFVTFNEAGELQGWATHPADPDSAPQLRLLIDNHARAHFILRAEDETLTTSSEDGPARRRGFTVPANKIPNAGRLRLVGPNGADVLGSPLCPTAEPAAAAAAAVVLRQIWPARPQSSRTASPDAWRPLPAALPAPPSKPRPIPTRAPVDVVIPVYRGVADFRACWDSLQHKRPSRCRIVVVDDATPDPALRDLVQHLAARKALILLHHPRNLGFPAAANTGLRHAASGREKRDVVLLNADTLTPPGWLPRLTAVAYATGDIGSVTPMTNEGTIVSYPHTNSEKNSLPDLAATISQDAQLRAANGKTWEELPTAVGFCMYIRHDCLADVGTFREDAFAQGYGEENDWCLRARRLGWRHVAATGIFVGHIGGRSFGAAKRHLLARNAAVLNRLHPGYDALIADFVARDPLAQARFRADAQAWAGKRAGRRAAILISHADGGGVERFVLQRCATLRASNLRPIVLRPMPQTTSDEAQDAPSTLECQVSEGDAEEYPQALPQLLDFLRAENPETVEIHHLLGHAEQMQALPTALGLPYQVFVHDYALWCPRITLCTKGPRYCGEPLDVAECEACVVDVGRRTGGQQPIGEMRAASAQFLRQATRVVAACEDVASRVTRHFPGVQPRVIPWEDETTLNPSPGQSRPNPAVPPWRVLVVGAIGLDKGYEVLLGCVRDAARRNLPLSFTVVGYTMDDSRLMDSGPIFVTGAFEEDEAISLTRAQAAHYGFVPSIWPETWCYALSTLWCAGLNVAAFAFGAPAQRISRAGRGIVLPVGLAPSRINDALIEAASAAARSAVNPGPQPQKPRALPTRSFSNR